MRFPPIPAFLRADEVEVERRTPSGFAPPVRIPRCIVELQGQVQPNAWQVVDGTAARVLIDASECPEGISEGDLVGHGGRRMAASSVRRIDNPDGTPHHWEVDCR